MVAGVNAWRLWNEHWEHVAHGPSLEEKPEYPYQNIRTKNYFWGDGDKVSVIFSYAWGAALSRVRELTLAFRLRLSSGTPRSTTTRSLKSKQVDVGV